MTRSRGSFLWCRIYFLQAARHSIPQFECLSKATVSSANQLKQEPEDYGAPRTIDDAPDQIHNP